MFKRQPIAVSGLILLAIAGAHAQAQGGILPISSHPQPVLERVSFDLRSHWRSGATLPDAPDAWIASTAMPHERGESPMAVMISVPATQPVCGFSNFGRCIQDFGEDQVGLWTSPFRLEPKDAYWMLPVGAATGLSFAYDVDATETAGVDAGRTSTFNKIANYGSPEAAIGEGVGIYFIGLAKGSPKLAETGRLGTEAVIDSSTATLAIKLLSNRQRPRQGTAEGDFWPYGLSHWESDSSFPSDHATASMALARVIAGEYPHWYVMAPAYGFAESVSISRVLAKQHFPSDLLVGQVIGFLTGNYLLNHRSLYRPGPKRKLVARMIGSVRPYADMGKSSFGASIDIPLPQ